MRDLIKELGEVKEIGLRTAEDIVEYMVEYMDMDEYITKQYPDYSKVKGYKFVSENYPSDCFYYKTEDEMENIHDEVTEIIYNANNKAIDDYLNDFISELEDMYELDEKTNAIIRELVEQYLKESTDDFIFDVYEVQFIEDPSIKEAEKLAIEQEAKKAELNKILAVVEVEEFLCACEGSDYFESIIEQNTVYGEGLDLDGAERLMAYNAANIRKALTELFKDLK